MADQPLRLAADLALAALDALIDLASPLGEFDQVNNEISRTGHQWLRRLAYAAALCRGGDARRCAEARSLASERERLGDEWGSVLIESIVALALMRSGRPDIALVERLCDRFRLLSASTLEAWARSALALALTEGDFPDTPVTASAEGLARAAGAPGPLALAYAAMGLADPERRTELMELAQSTALAGGLEYPPLDVDPGRPAAPPGRVSRATPRNSHRESQPRANCNTGPPATRG